MVRQNIIPLLIAIIAIFISSKAHGQDVNTSQQIAERILTAAQNHSSEGIDELLAPEFHVSNIKQPTAGTVLKQIIAQMPIITRWEQSSIERDSTGLILRYILTGSDSTTTEATFLFNADNMVVEADLLQAKVSVRTATPTANLQTGVNMARVPIYRHNGLPIVTVTIDGKLCNMFFDTGAPGVILNSKYFDNDINGLVMGGGGRGAVGKGTASGMHHVELMDMGGITLTDTDIMTSDLSNLETVGIEVHGILGQSFYKNLDVLFDFKGNEIVLLNPDTTHQWLLSKGYRCQTISGLMKGHLLTFGCEVGGTPVVLAFDSGAQTNLLASDWPRLHPSSTVKRVKKGQLKGYGEGEASMIKGKTTLLLGGRTFKKQETTFYDVSHLQEKGIDGLFGCEVLAKQKLLISYKHQELMLID